MDRRIPLFAALVAVQLLVIAGVLFADARTEATPEFLSFEPASVVRIEVSGEAGGEPVVIERAGEGWRLPDYGGGLPADADAVAGVLDKLAGADAPWPVATTAGAAERFEVTEETFQRRIVLRGADGEALTDVYLGTSPGFQKVHARRAGSDEVFAIEFSNYEAGTTAEDWLDETLLAVEDFERVSRPDEFTLEKVDSIWRFADAAEGEILDQSEASSIASRFENLRVQGLIEDPAELAETEPTVVYEVGPADAATRFTFHAREDDWAVKSSARDGYFRIGSYVGEQLERDRTALVSTPEEDADQVAAGDGGEDADSGAATGGGDGADSDAATDGGDGADSGAATDGGEDAQAGAAADGGEPAG